MWMIGRNCGVYTEDDFVFTLNNDKDSVDGDSGSAQAALPAEPNLSISKLSDLAPKGVLCKRELT